MHKILTVHDLSSILLTEASEHGGSEEFIEDIANVITKHFGGEVGTVSFEEGATDPYWIVIHKDERIPQQDSVYDDYDGKGWREENS